MTYSCALVSRNSAISAINRQYQEAMNFFNSGKLSDKDCTSHPFFLKGSPPIEPNVGFNTAKVNAILGEVPLPPKIKKIYQIIGETNVEHYTENWILITLDKIKLIHDKYIAKGQHRANDFALIYTGMGHVAVCSYDPETDKIYYRMDGGSNGYDRDDYYKFAYTYVPKEEHLHDIQHFFDTVKEANDTFSIPLVN